MSEPDAEAYAAAERLVREAHARAEQAAREAGAGIPRDGWAGERPATTPFPDLSGLLALVDAARGSLPPELARALADALRELLIALRAIIDYSLERLDRTPPSDPHVEDIPIS